VNGPCLVCGTPGHACGPAGDHGPPVDTADRMEPAVTGTLRRYPHPNGRPGQFITADDRLAAELGLLRPAAAPDWPGRVERIIVRAATGGLTDPEATTVRAALDQHPGAPATLDLVARLETLSDAALVADLRAWLGAMALAPVSVDDDTPQDAPAAVPRPPAPTTARRRPKATPDA
jgi:hypothetical protein